MRLCINLTEIMGLDCTDPLVRVTAAQWLECYETYPDSCLGSYELAKAAVECYEPPPVGAPNPYVIDLSAVLGLSADSCDIAVSMDQWNCVYKTHPQYCYGGKSKSVVEREEARVRRAEAKSRGKKDADPSDYIVDESDVSLFIECFRKVQNSEGYADKEALKNTWRATAKAPYFWNVLTYLRQNKHPILGMLL